MFSKYLPVEYWTIDDVFSIPFFNNSNTYTSTKTYNKDLVEKENEYLYVLAVPGLSKEDIKVNLDGDFIVVSYSIEKEADKTYFVTSNFKKTMTLPKDVNKQGIEAEVKNGVLTVILPKQVKKTTEPKQIEVK